MSFRLFVRLSCSVLIALLTLGGCTSRLDFEKCVRRNDILNKRLEELLANQENSRIEAQNCKQQLDILQQKRQYDDQKVKALQAALEDKNALIEHLSDQLGHVTVPVVLSNALADWARRSGSQLVTYDEKTGMVRFKSDLLFDEGDDTVRPEAVEKLKALSRILNSPAAQDFDVLIVGHTDDKRIGKPATKAKHPTNWHLSAHRAIAVQKQLADAGMQQMRLAVMGMGQFHPIEPNKPNMMGNPKNRRVEIYIVPAGQIGTARLITPPKP